MKGLTVIAGALFLIGLPAISWAASKSKAASEYSSSERRKAAGVPASTSAVRHLPKKRGAQPALEFAPGIKADDAGGKATSGKNFASPPTYFRLQ
jgi:hypothetical protein